MASNWNAYENLRPELRLCKPLGIKVRKSLAVRSVNSVVVKVLKACNNFVGLSYWYIYRIEHYLCCCIYNLYCIFEQSWSWQIFIIEAIDLLFCKNKLNYVHITRVMLIYILINIYLSTKLKRRIFCFSFHSTK